MTLTRIDLDLTDQQLQDSLVSDASRGLLAAAKILPPKYFYDQRGSDLFERITELPEYYPTRLERSILSQHADQMFSTAPAFNSLVELGSGSSSKTPLCWTRCSGEARTRATFLSMSACTRWPAP